MLDFTDDRHKRGLMILTSKDVRTVERTLFNWEVQSRSVIDYLNLIEHKLNKDEIDAHDMEDIKRYIKNARDYCIEAERLIDECRKVFM